MNKPRNWLSRAIYTVIAMALVLGMTLVPGTPTAQAQGTLPTIDPPDIAYNVKGSIHKVCIDLNDWQVAYNAGLVTIDWWLESGVALSPDDITVLEPTGPNPWSANTSYQETIKTRDTMDNDVLCVELRSMKRGDIHIFAEVTLYEEPGMVLESIMLHTEKKWGEIWRTELDVDPDIVGVQQEKEKSFPAGYTGIYEELITDTVHATFLEVPGDVPADGARVHWWLFDDTDTNRDLIQELMDYLESQDGVRHDYYSAAGKYRPVDWTGREPWKVINDYAIWTAIDPVTRHAPTSIFSWGDINPAAPDGDIWPPGFYAWNTSIDGGKAQATVNVDVDELEPCVPENIMIVVLVSYPSGSTPQDDPFNGENRVAVEVGFKEYHKAKKPDITQVKTPQLRWAGEKAVLETNWPVDPSTDWTIAATKTVADNETVETTWGASVLAVRYPALYFLELGSIGNLEPVVSEDHWAGLSIETLWSDTIDISGEVPGGFGAQEVISHSNGAVILSTEMSGQADVNAAIYEIYVEAEVSGSFDEELDPEDIIEADFETIRDWIADGTLVIEDSPEPSIHVSDGPMANYGFLVYFLEFEDVVLADITPPDSITGLEPQVDDAEIAVQVRGYFDYNHSQLPATTRVAEEVYLPGETIGTVLPAGRYVLPDDWVLLAGTNDIALRPNFDLMDAAHHDDIVSPYDYSPYDGLEALGAYNNDVRTTDPPGEAEFPTIGPFSTLQLWSIEGKWVTEASVPTSYWPGGRNTVVPDGIIDRWDAPMPPALVIFDIVEESEDASLSQLLKRNLEGYGFQWDGGAKQYQSPFYSVEIPASPFIPAGYNWDSWGGDGPYDFWTDLLMDGRWDDEDPVDPDVKDVEVYSDNHGIAAVSIDALSNTAGGHVTITATADFPYTPKMGKYGPRVSEEITATWGEVTIEMNPWFLADKTEVEVDETITFTNLTTGGVPPYVRAEWNFGDGTAPIVYEDPAGTGVLNSVTHSYAAPGLYDVSLTMTDSQDIMRTEIRHYYILVLGEPVEPEPDEPGMEDGLESIADELVIAYYYAGAGVWNVYWPAFDIDTIGMLEVGEIYMIYVDADCTLEYGSQSYELTGPDWNFVYWLAQ